MTFQSLVRSRSSLVIIALLLTSLTPYAQTTINAVYAGSEYSQNADAGYMERIDYVYYLRPDGSFCSELDRADWKKKINGTYRINGNLLIMKFLNDGAERVILLGVTGETGQSGAATFIKMEVTDKIPAGYYQYIRANGRQEGLYFGENGQFSHNKNSVIAVTDNGPKGDEAGNYTINGSELNLSASDGRKSSWSFFCNKGDGTIAVINGKIFYRDGSISEIAKQKTPPQQQAQPQHTETATTTTTKPAVEKPAAGDNSPEAAMALLQLANKTHGGKYLDNLNTLKAVMMTNNLTLTMMADFSRQFIRIESSIQKNVILIEQLEGQNGWSWDGHGYTSLSAARVGEMKRYLMCGQLGLRTEILSHATATVQRQQEELTSIVMTVDNIRAGYIINNKISRLEALILPNDNNATSSHTYTDYKKVSNLLLPFTEIIQAGTHAQVITYDSYTINPNFSTSDWAKP